jgi:hypothetical protein
MTKKVYTMDDLHDLIGEAIETVRHGLLTGEKREACEIASQLLQLPISCALNMGQQEKNQFQKFLPDNSADKILTE